jgi:hypothetical protein
MHKEVKKKTFGSGFKAYKEFIMYYLSHNQKQFNKAHELLLKCKTRT